MRETEFRGDGRDTAFPNGARQCAMGRVEPKFGQQHRGRAAESLDATEMQRALPGPDRDAKLCNGRRIVETCPQDLQQLARNSGAAVKGFDDLSGGDHVEDDVENAFLDFRDDTLHQ